MNMIYRERMDNGYCYKHGAYEQHAVKLGWRGTMFVTGCPACERENKLAVADINIRELGIGMFSYWPKQDDGFGGVRTSADGPDWLF